jgi:hypothetical protein
MNRMDQILNQRSQQDAYYENRSTALKNYYQSPEMIAFRTGEMVSKAGLTEAEVKSYGSAFSEKVSYYLANKDNPAFQIPPTDFSEELASRAAAQIPKLKTTDPTGQAAGASPATPAAGQAGRPKPQQPTASGATPPTGQAGSTPVRATGTAPAGYDVNTLKIDTTKSYAKTGIQGFFKSLGFTEKATTFLLGQVQGDTISGKDLKAILLHVADPTGKTPSDSVLSPEEAAAYSKLVEDASAKK